MLCAPGFFSTRYRPNPRPSCSANCGVSSFATSPRMSYSRKTCIGMGIRAPVRNVRAGPLRDNWDCRRRVRKLLANEPGAIRVVRVAVVVSGPGPVTRGRWERGVIAEQRVDVATIVSEVQDTFHSKRRLGRDAR